MKTFIYSAAAFALTAPMAFAQIAITDPTLPKNDPVSVPEISALEGTAALAALAAIVLLTWERRRRAA